MTDDQSYRAAIERSFPRNRIFILVFEGVWGLGLALGMLFTVVPAYLMVLGAPKALIGLVASSWTILSPLQMIAGYLLAGKLKHRWLTLGYSVSVVPWLLYSIASFAKPELFSGSGRIVIFTCAILWFASSVTMADASYLSLMIDSVPQNRRGRLVGLRLLVLAGATGISTLIARFVMDLYPEPRSYHLSFIIATSLYVVGSLTFLGINEHLSPHRRWRDADTGSKMRLRGFIARIVALFRAAAAEPNYRVMIFFVVILFAARDLNVYVVTFARDTLGISGSEVAVFTFIRIAAAAVVGLSVGRAADSTGYRSVGIVMACCFIVSFAVMSVASKQGVPPRVLLYAAYGVQTGAGSLSVMVLSNLSAEIMVNEDTALLIALGNMIVLPILLVTQPLFGFVVDASGDYFTVFLIGLVLSIIGTVGFALLVHEPRGRRRYAFRYPRRPG